MLSLGQLLILNIGLFVVFAWIFTIEQRKQRRLFLVNFRRSKLDVLTDKSISFLLSKLNYIGRHIIIKCHGTMAYIDFCV
jgi:hypothetical protein